MKGVLLILFTLLSPIAIFLTMIVFMPPINTTIKQQLVKVNAYEKISEQLRTLSTDDADSAAVNSILQRVLTPQYLQGKLEPTIDMSYSWIVGATSTPPVISFKDIKEDIVRQNPQLLSTIEQMSKEMKDAPSDAKAMDGQPAEAADAASPDQQQTEEMTKSIDQMAALAKSDFTFPLDKQLLGIKSFYTTVHIWQPLLAIALLGILICIGLLAHSWKSRLRWIGVTLLFGAAFGYGFVVITTNVTTFITGLLSKATDAMMVTVSPLILQVVTSFANTYTQYQTTVCIVSVVVGAMLVVTSFFMPSGSSITQIKPSGAKAMDGKQTTKRKQK